MTNKVILMGRFARDPEVRYTDAPMCVARFPFAVDRKRSKEEQEQKADFINCVAFGKTAEFIEKYAKKGDKFLIEGHIQTGSYTNKEGKKVYTTDVAVESLEFAQSKFSGAAEPTTDQGDGFMSIPDGIEEELPFN